MAQRPSFGALKKTKPAPDVVPLTKNEPAPAASESKPVPRIQTSVRLDPAMWAALNDLATRKRVEDGRRVTVHDLLIEGGRHILAVHGVKLS
jgi:hypothetical protein